MELLEEVNFKILADGQQKIQINDFRDIDLELGRSEKEELSKTITSYSSEQKDFNSAEQYNIKHRTRYQVMSYDLSEFSTIYLTKEFKILKLAEIENTAKYLKTLLLLLANINKHFKSTSKDYRNFELEGQHSEAEFNYLRAKDVISNCFGLMCELKANIDELINNPVSVSVRSSYEELMNNVKIQLSVHQVPKDLSEVINTVFPGIPLSKFESEEITSKNWQQFSYFCSWVEKFNIVLHYFVENLINEFSFFVTPEDFLNNPIGKTIFVIPSHLYKKMNFRRGGLLRNECINIESSTVKNKVYKKYEELYNEINEGLSGVLKCIKSEKKSILEQPSSSILDEFMDAYSQHFKNTTFESLAKLEFQMEDPRFVEKLEELLVDLRYYMLEELKTGLSPWECTIQDTPVNRQRDIDTVLYLLFVYRKYLGYTEQKTVPQTQLCRLFNLFAYANDPVKRMNTHTVKYSKKENLEECFSPSFFEEFLPVLLM